MQIDMLKVQALQGGASEEAVRTAIKAIDGVVHVQVADSGRMATVQYDASLVSRGQVEATLEQAGYRVAQPAAAGCCGGCCGS